MHHCAQRRIIARAECAFEDAPAVVAATPDYVYLFASALPDVGDVQLTRGAVKRKAPGVAQPVGINLVAARRRAGERVIKRRAVRLTAARVVYVNAQNLAEQFVDILRAIAGVVGRAAIAHADVEISIRPELDHAPVVILVWLRNEEQHGLRRQGDVWI